MLRSWAARLPTAAAFSPRQVNRLLATALLTYVVGAIVGAAIELLAFADGAFHIFGIASGDPWHMSWDGLPGRFSTFLLTIEPWAVLVRAGVLPLSAIPEAYGFLFLLLPAVFLALCPPLVAPSKRHLLAYPAIQMLVTGLFLYGFVSELWPSQGEFWVSLLAVIGGAGGRRRTAAFVIAFPLLVFSHDAAILAAGLVFLVLAGRLCGLGTERATPAPDRLLLLYAAIVLASWIVVKLAYTGPDPVFNAIGAGNPVGVVNPLALVRSKGFVLAVFTAIGACPLILRRAAPPSRLVSGIILAAAGVAALIVYVLSPWPGSRYALRGAMLVSLLVLGALATTDSWSSEAGPERRAAGRTASAGWVYLLVVAVMVQQDVRNLAFARDWVAYRSAVRALTGGGAAGQAVPTDFDTAAADLPQRQKRVLDNLNWGWPLPFQSFDFSDGYRIDRMLFLPGRRATISCATAHRTLLSARRIPDVAKRRLTAYICGGGRSA